MQEMMMLFQILTFPVTGPLRTVAWIGGAIRDAVDSKMNDPAEIKRALAALEQQLEAGSLSEQDYERMEMELIERELHGCRAVQGLHRGHHCPRQLAGGTVPARHRRQRRHSACSSFLFSILHAFLDAATHRADGSRLPSFVEQGRRARRRDVRNGRSGA